MFKINHEEAGKGFELVAKGDYEVFVHNYEQKVSSTGKNMIVVDYEIRTDVDQPHGGQKIQFDNFIIGEKSMWRLQAISKAAQFPQGLEFATYKEWADTLMNKHLIITIGHREHNGNLYPEVKGFKVSKVAAPNAATVKVTEDEVPF